MNENVLAAIEKKIGVAGIGDLLADRLSGSELSSLLLEVYRRKTGQLRPADLLAQYRQNRLVQPAGLDMIALLESEVATLKFFRGYGFKPVELSPVAALGSCSVIASVSQDKVVSAVRNTEIVADATNSLALLIADRRKRGDGGIIRLSTVHRQVRTQAFADARYLPHFVIGCMVTGGRTTGSYLFEFEAITEHIGVYIELLRKKYGIGKFRLLLLKRGGDYDERNALVEHMERWLRAGQPEIAIDREDAPPANEYYKGVQFKLYITVKGVEREIADGGFVDWTQRLLENKKERLLISGFGLELLVKMQQELL